MNDKKIKYMIEIYGNSCWMNGNVSKNNELTLHHIIPVREKRNSKYYNLALLSNDMHIFYNFIEKNYEAEAFLLTELFIELNNSACPPTEEYKKDINIILSRIKN